MGSIQLRWFVSAQCCLIAATLGMTACGSDNGDDDDGATDEEHAPSACADDDHHSDEAAEDDGGEADHDAEPVGKSSGATCPDNNTLTYDNFGKKFMTDYCVRCHSSELECEDRSGAPLGHDFDTLPGILLVGEHIDQKAASGPNSTNLSMPKDGKKPSLEEREKLGQWLACELDKLND